MIDKIKEYLKAEERDAVMIVLNPMTDNYAVSQQSVRANTLHRVLKYIEELENEDRS